MAYLQSIIVFDGRHLIEILKFVIQFVSNSYRMCDCIFCSIFSIAVFTDVFMLVKLYFIMVTASASVDPEASLSVLSHNTLHLS